MNIETFKRAALRKDSPYDGHIILPPDGVLVTDGHLLVCRMPGASIESVCDALANATAMGHIPSAAATRRVLQLPRTVASVSTVTTHTPADAALGEQAQNTQRARVLAAEEELAKAEHRLGNAAKGRVGEARALVTAAKAALRGVQKATDPRHDALAFAARGHEGDRACVARALVMRALKALGVTAAHVEVRGAHDPILLSTPNGIALVMPLRGE